MVNISVRLPWKGCGIMSKLKKRIFVSGGCGFIGSAFVRHILKAGNFQVHILDSLSYAGDLSRIKDAKSQFTFHKVNICNRKEIEKLFKRYKPEFFCHFAAETHVDRSILYPHDAVKTNVVGTHVLLEASKEWGVKKFIYVSTDEVYGEVLKGEFTEKSPLFPSSPYSAGKAAGDMLVQAYVKTYGFPAITVRPSNNYGPWQYPEKLIPVVIYKALAGEAIPVYGRGLNVREWLYVSDCAEGIYKVLTKGRVGEIYNLGSQQEQENIYIIKKLLKILNKPESLIEFVKDRPGHDFRYALNATKITRELGFKPRMKLDEGLRLTVDFYLSHQNWFNRKAKQVSRFWTKVYSKA